MPPLMPDKTLTHGAGWQGRAKSWATQHEYSQVYLAAAVSEILGLEEERWFSRATIGHWLSGRNSPTVPQFLALCQAMGADPGEILFGVKVLPSMVSSKDLREAMHAQPASTEGHRRLMSAIESKARTFKRKKTKLRRRVLTS
jgi:transcriptional regulator with XRE-family HTH domain